ncbi:MAG: cysteine rich repeat-containing protein [Candidatus Binatia bacterium]
MLLVAAGALLGVAFLAAPAEAAGRGACAEEVKKVCGDVEPGGGRLRDCVKANEASFSAECRERMQRMRERHERVAEACGADAQKHCSGVERGGGRMLRCLREHEDELSTDCREAFRRRAGREHRRPAPESAPPSGGEGPESKE